MDVQILYKSGGCLDNFEFRLDDSKSARDKIFPRIKLLLSFLNTRPSVDFSFVKASQSKGFETDRITRVLEIYGKW